MLVYSGRTEAVLRKNFAAILDKGSLREPPIMALVIFLIFFLFHLRGLDRAEKRKLNPAVV